ncbi:hypothetical protein GOBAR_DD33395 [Gossypium barbadense]|nr:hypothetical protein GOBAR_DD33395 [Gossypium barbadense]
MMEQVPGALGTSASLALHSGQTIFSSASLLFIQDQTTYIEDGFPRTPQVAPFTSADDTAPLLENGSSVQDQTTYIEDGFPRTPQVAPFTSADDTAPLLENGSSDDKLNFDGPMDFNEDLCRSSSFNGTMVGEENAVSMLVPSYSQEQLPEIFVGLKSQQGCIGEMSDVEDETFNTVVSRSSQTCRIDLLEEIIEDAKDNKDELLTYEILVQKILFQTMQSIMNLMKEVELQEAAAEQAKEETARGALIFSSSWRNLNRCCHMQRKQMTWFAALVKACQVGNGVEGAEEVTFLYRLTPGACPKSRFEFPSKNHNYPITDAFPKTETVLPSLKSTCSLSLSIPPEIAEITSTLALSLPLEIAAPVSLHRLRSLGQLFRQVICVLQMQINPKENLSNSIKMEDCFESDMQSIVLLKFVLFR